MYSFVGIMKQMSFETWLQIVQLTFLTLCSFWRDSADSADCYIVRLDLRGFVYFKICYPAALTQSTFLGQFI